jgi:hypothetical protein
LVAHLPSDVAFVGHSRVKMHNWLQNYFEIECRDSDLFIYLSFLNLRGLDGANGLIEKNDPIKQKDI